MNRTLRSLQTIGKSNAVFRKTTQPVQITKRLKRTSTISKKGLNETLQKQNQQSNEALFGLKPVDFTVVPPIRHGAPPPPPKPEPIPAPMAASSGMGIQHSGNWFTRLFKRF